MDFLADDWNPYRFVVVLIMPYTWNENAVPDAIEFCHGMADRIEEGFREEHNLGDAPFETWEARMLRAVEDHMIDTIALILFRVNTLNVPAKIYTPTDGGK